MKQTDVFSEKAENWIAEGGKFGLFLSLQKSNKANITLVKKVTHTRIFSGK
jgi:hypothetical protein